MCISELRRQRRLSINSQAMLCSLFSANALPAPMITYPSLDPSEASAWKFDIQHRAFLLGQLIWICCLQISSQPRIPWCRYFRQEIVSTSRCSCPWGFRQDAGISVSVYFYDNLKMGYGKRTWYCPPFEHNVHTARNSRRPKLIYVPMPHKPHLICFRYCNIVWRQLWVFFDKFTMEWWDRIISHYRRIWDHYKTECPNEFC